jgi:hypothetical protein
MNILATDVEGIFRLAGSEKRIKELKIAFDTPPRWGKGLDWTGYTVHDAANILRRYFNQLPEPIIPLQHYDPFRQPLRNHQAEAVGHLEGQAPSIGGFDPDSAVRLYQHRIKDLPSLNRQLLLYILDLLAVFAAKSDVNKMTTSNLAAIFQPGILSHPQHDMSPQDYRLSQDVLIFLIDNQDHFLIGMEGTAVDEGTLKHVESGPSTPQARTPTTPGRNKSGLGRSASTASSAGAESMRKYGAIRRNVSTSSRQSRHSTAVPSPTTPAFNAPSSGSGVHRSNTVPSNRSPAIPGARFGKSSGPPTPSAEEPKTQFIAPTDSLVATTKEEPERPMIPSEKIDVIAQVPKERVEEVKPAAIERVTTIPVAANTSAQAAESAAEYAAEPAPELAPEPAPESVPESAPESTPGFAAESTTESAATPTPTTPVTATTTPDHAPKAVPIPEPDYLAPAPPIHAYIAPAVTTPTFEGMPGAFPPPTPGLIAPTPVEEVNPFASIRSPISSSGAQVLSAPTSPPFGRRSPHITPTREMSEFMEAPVDSGPTHEPAPAVSMQRTFTQILSKVPPSGEDKDGRKPKKLQKKTRATSGAIPSAHSSTNSFSVHDNPPSPLPHPTMPHFHPSGSKEVLQSYPNDTASSRNSGVTLKPNMSPSASFRSHSTATEYSETEQVEEVQREEKRSFWKSHKRSESKATPTASQTDLHGSVPGGDKSMSSFGSSGWAGASRQSFQHDSHQGSDTSMPYNIPIESKEHGEKKSKFGWLRGRRYDHEGDTDRKHRTLSPRALSPTGLSSEMRAPQALVAPTDAQVAQGRLMDMPKRATSEGSSDVTPTGTSRNPLAAPIPHNPNPNVQAQAQVQPSAPPTTLTFNAMPTAPTLQAAPNSTAPAMPHFEPPARAPRQPSPRALALQHPSSPRTLAFAHPPGSPRTLAQATAHPSPKLEPSAQPHYQSLIPPLDSDPDLPSASPPKPSAAPFT